jgi:hypothetical protein
MPDGLWLIEVTMMSWLRRLWAMEVEDHQSVIERVPQDVLGQQQLGAQQQQQARQELINAFNQAVLQDRIAQQQVDQIQIDARQALDQAELMQQTLSQQLGINQVLFGMPIIENLQTFDVELKMNGILEPDLKEGDLLAVDVNALAQVRSKISLMKYKSPRHRTIIETTRNLGNTNVVYRGEWGFDEKLDEYLIQTGWTSRTMLPLSIFIKLPKGLDECIEVMEKSLWSSRKSPITKKDIA